jgi:SMC interacting uncharacterized protein involved in chromosome segregation
MLLLKRIISSNGNFLKSYYDLRNTIIITVIKSRQKETLDIAEQKQTETKVKRQKLEGELQKMKLTIQDKETEVQLMKERCDSLGQVQALLFL